MSLQLAAAVVVAKGTVHKAGKCTAVQVCWQTGIISRSVGYIRISPEYLPLNLNR